MREIKFRMKIKGDAKLWDVEAIDFLNLKALRNVSGSLEWVGFERIESFLQFTGLLDKQSKKIYEGDIVTGKDGHYRPFKGVVEFKSEWGRVVIDEDLTLTFGIAKQCEVIGNIYENPELLENK